MFTGIVAEQGTVVSLAPDASGAGSVLVLDVPTAAAGLEPGGSIAVDGVCLTAVGPGTAGPAGTRLTVDVMGETLARTTVGGLRPGARVNLERCVPAGGRLDGHVVQGHVDGVGSLLEREDLGSWERLRFAVPAPLARYIAEKGSIAVNGVSLTVSAVSAPSAAEPWFEVGLIPTTLAETNLGTLTPGAPVNLEVDVLAKYAERLLAFASVPAGQGNGQ